MSHPLLRLVRLDSSLLVALAVFMPLFARTNDFALSIRNAIPMLLIGMCTFIANDMDDVEKDRINHPERPLPSGQIRLHFAAALYFACLVAALFSTREYVSAKTAFWYYLLTALSISYGYVVDYFPWLKAPYVALATSIPALIIAITYRSEARLLLVTGAAFFFVLGREICMDILDRSGDRWSFIHRIDAKPLAGIAFLCEAMGLFLLAVQVNTLSYAIAAVAVATLLAWSAHCWVTKNYKSSVVAMKMQLFVGLYFLT